MKKIDLTYEERRVLRAIKIRLDGKKYKRFAKSTIDWLVWEYCGITYSDGKRKSQAVIDSLVKKGILRKFWLKSYQEHTYALTKKGLKNLPNGWISWKEAYQVLLHVRCEKCGLEKEFVIDGDGRKYQYDEEDIPTESLDGWDMIGKSLCGICKHEKKEEK